MSAWTWWMKESVLSTVVLDENATSDVGRHNYRRWYALGIAYQSLWNHGSCFCHSHNQWSNLLPPVPDLRSFGTFQRVVSRWEHYSKAAFHDSLYRHQLQPLIAVNYWIYSYLTAIPLLQVRVTGRCSTQRNNAEKEAEYIRTLRCQLVALSC